MQPLGAGGIAGGDYVMQALSGANAQIPSKPASVCVWCDPLLCTAELGQNLADQAHGVCAVSGEQPSSAKKMGYHRFY